MRIVIAGAGEVGTHLAKMLSQSEHEIILIDSEAERLKPVDAALDVLTYRGIGHIYSTCSGRPSRSTPTSLLPLRTMRIQTSPLPSWQRSWVHSKVIARIDNMEYLERANKEFFREMGVDHLIYPELIAAKEVISLLKETGTTEFMDFAGGLLSLYVQKLEKNAPVLNRSLEEVSQHPRDRS
ncbi:MAG: NAD-binding protein [Sphingobacterium sp.]|nr:NAD-binding protein [Sphingobacterium sp.]